MKIWLDDEYEARKGWFPETWVYCRWPDEVIEHLRTGKVEAISLDHDLGDSELAKLEKRREVTGYDVLEWLEESVAVHCVAPPQKINVHSANASGRLRMEAAIASIRKWQEKNGL